MPAVTIQGGMRVEIPNQDEIRGVVRDTWDERDRNLSRGLKNLRFLGVPPSGAPQIGTTGSFNIPYGPSPGYIWSVRLVAAQLSTAASLRGGLGYGEGDTTVPLISVVNTGTTTYPVQTFSAGQFFLNYGETLALFASATATLVSYGLFVVESPAERLGALII